MSENRTSSNQPATTNPTHNHPSSRPESSINLGAGLDKAAHTSFPSERGVKPENWEGDRVKTNRFVNEFRNYLALNEDRYPTVVDQQAIFLTLLGGDIGAAWADREEALLLFIKHGLHLKLVDRVSGTYPSPKGLEGYKKRAVELQNEYLSHRAEAARWKNTHLGNYVTCSQTTATSTTMGRVAADAGASKEVNAFKAPGASSPLIPLNKLTPEEQQWCVDKGLVEAEVLPTQWQHGTD
ncbi:hypothetical protein AAF712_011572 [Marasmius tenuissimus]|uniref:Uncharacterized protein n=1 Tax=Marasmius tenuissimus TaxID=585030 RepID=A0ABR2ZJU6_9AGAR